LVERQNVERHPNESEQHRNINACGTLNGFIHYTNHSEGQIYGVPVNGDSQIIDEGEFVGSNEDCENVEI